MTRTKRPKQAIGWREWLVLPDLCPTPIKAKVDTGAQTSALHAFRLKVSRTGDVPIATFIMHPHQRSTRDSVEVRAEVVGYKKVRSSNGRLERRPVISTRARMGATTLDIDVTLTRRDEMGFRMLLGRSAVRRRFLVDPGRSYIATPKDMGSMT